MAEPQPPRVYQAVMDPNTALSTSSPYLPNLSAATLAKLNQHGIKTNGDLSKFSTSQIDQFPWLAFLQRTEVVSVRNSLPNSGGYLTELHAKTPPNGKIREAWEAAQILEEIIRDADVEAARKRIVESIVGEVETKGPVEMKINYSGAELTVQYHYFGSKIMQGVQGTLQDVVDLLSTGLKEGQEVFLQKSNQADEIELVIRVKYTDAATLGQFRESRKWH
jgi:hypothetical protein